MNRTDTHPVTLTDSPRDVDDPSSASYGGDDDALGEFLPVLPSDPTDDDLCRFVGDALLDEVDDDVLYWLFVDDDGRPCHPILAMTDRPDEPDRPYVEQLVDRMSAVGSAVGASRLILVWQYLERTPEAARRTRRWTSLLTECFPWQPALIAQVARTPEYLQVLMRNMTRTPSVPRVSAPRSTGGRP